MDSLRNAAGEGKEHDAQAERSEYSLDFSCLDETIQTETSSYLIRLPLR